MSSTQIPHDQVATVSTEELAPHFDLYDSEHCKRIDEVLKYSRESESCPIIKTDADDGYFIVTRYDDLKTVANDPETFSSIQPALRGTPVPMPPVSVDPPLHREFRKILNPYFSRNQVARYADDLRSSAAQLLDPVVGTGRIEFMHQYALPYTAKNLCRVILGETSKDQIERASDAALRISTVGDQQAFVDLATIAAEFISEREEVGFDEDTLLAGIINGTIEDRPLKLEEKVGLVTTLFSGGLDTVRGALGNITLHMAKDPSVEARLRDPDWMRTDLDELLRYDTPITYLARTVTRDTEVNGCPMKAGDRIAMHFGSANRDADYFDSPDSLDFGRTQNAHIAFGAGIHRCVGLHFARLQIEVGIAEFLARVENLRVPAGAEVEHSDGVIYTPENLPLEFDPR